MQLNVPAELLTPLVNDAAALVRESIVAELTGAFEDTLESLPVAELPLESLFALSPYMATTSQRYPDELARLLREGALEQTTSIEVELSATLVTKLMTELVADMSARTSVLDAEQIEKLQMEILRRFRHRHMLRILWRDLLGIACLDETLTSLTAMADACVCMASQWAHAALLPRYGEPQDKKGHAQKLIVLGMGKLGGCELNVSSDIDLIYCWPAPGQTEGPKRVDNAEFFRRVAQRLTRLIGAVTEDGFVFRVDTRLRPFGESGPLVMNFEGLENYYLTQGRDWERYAMIKARPITGDVAALQELDTLLKPFIYRRYLDYNAIDSLRELKRKIMLSVKQRALIDNIKLGVGGIREVEFIGQAFQLVRGGREPRLQQRPIRKVLNTLIELDLMPAEDVHSLVAAYEYLRRVENAVQMMRDEQVHSLPVDVTDQKRLLCMMGEADWPAFRVVLKKHQNIVAMSFSALFASGEAGKSEDSRGEKENAADGDQAAMAVWAIVSSPETPQESVTDALQTLGIDVDEALLETTINVCRGAFYNRMSAQGQERIDRVLPLIFDAVMREQYDAIVLSRCLALVRAVAGRSGYLQVLGDYPVALKRLIDLFAGSSWLAEFVTRHPIVIDELLDTQTQPLLLNQEAITREAMAQAKRLIERPLDEQMDSLRHFRQTRELRIAAAELEGEMPLTDVSDQLSWLAEAMVSAVFHLVSLALASRFGWPRCQENGQMRQPEVGIIAYGKLGGVELGYGSDLDLVFVHDSAGEAQFTDGDKSIDNSVWYARLAQKFVHFMGTATPAGVLYEIDFRLRPNGQSGVLVTGLDAFARYQADEAWTWEHQALLRTRLILGSSALHKRFDGIRAKVLSERRSAEALRKAVSDMRERMRKALGNHESGRMHLKQDAGGVADIEFVVQYLALAHAADHPDIIIHTDNIRVVEAAAAEGLLEQTEANTLVASYIELRSRLHRQALHQRSAIVDIDPALEVLRQGIIRIREAVLGPVSSEQSTKSTLTDNPNR
ncbi:MAG: bifunctional [glutamate--ammonia ligase]-adenylyl-L-tyrosine phosphorylase/[glutamate--ammonia-ligase] adenylyltransferase [Granulosicoccus sp.]